MYVDNHNSFRSQIDPPASNMKKMELDTELETLAKQWASRCVFEHGNPPNDFKGGIGQNLYMSTNRDDIVQEAIKRWYAEFEYYSLDSNTCQTNKVCGHYTQLMWANTYKVGCGLSELCPNNCRYRLSNESIDSKLLSFHRLHFCLQLFTAW